MLANAAPPLEVVQVVQLLHSILTKSNLHYLINVFWNQSSPKCNSLHHSFKILKEILKRDRSMFFSFSYDVSVKWHRNVSNVSFCQKKTWFLNPNSCMFMVLKATNWQKSWPNLDRFLNHGCKNSKVHNSIGPLVLPAL